MGVVGELTRRSRLEGDGGAKEKFGDDGEQDEVEPPTDVNALTSQSVPRVPT